MKLFKLCMLAVASLFCFGCNKKSQPSKQVKQVEDVVTDINEVFNPLVGGEDIMSYYEDYGCWIGGLNLGAAEATTEEEHITELKDAVEFIGGYLPEYLKLGESGYESEEDDYYIGYSVDSVGVDMFGYVNASSYVIVQIQVAELQSEGI